MREKGRKKERSEKEGKEEEVKLEVEVVERCDLLMKTRHFLLHLSMLLAPILMETSE